MRNRIVYAAAAGLAAVSVTTGVVLTQTGGSDSPKKVSADMNDLGQRLVSDDYRTFSKACDRMDALDSRVERLRIQQPRNREYRRWSQIVFGMEKICFVKEALAHAE